MLLFNETYGIDPDIEQEWLRYIREVHCPKALETGMFKSIRLFKVLHEQEDGSVSYSLQYFAESIEQVQQYLEVFAPMLIRDHQQKFNNKHVAFRTLLEEIGYSS